ncbi:tetratricopeptide repeat protein [Thiovibrio sp. JS02]
MKKNTRMPSLLFARIVALLLLAGVSGFGATVDCCRAEDAGGAAQPAAVSVDPASLWQEAQAAATAGELAEAADLYQRYYEGFRESDKAEEALWQAAQLAKRQAQEGPSPDWERVRNLFRMFSTDFAESARAAEAYFEVGYAHYQMRFFREALIYFKLFGDRYPKSPFLDKALYWQGRTLLQVGRAPEAAEVFQRLEKSAKEPDLRAEAAVGIGNWLYAEGKYPEALARLQEVMRAHPSYYLKDPEVLYDLGLVYQKLGKEKEAQRYFYHYLNLIENLKRKHEVIFDLAESYHRQGDNASAQSLYRRIVEEGSPADRPVVLAQFRIAEYFDDQERALSKWQKRNDLGDPAGDRPLLAVVDGFHGEPIAQDARRGLFIRYRARDQFEQAFEVGKSFLRNDEAGVRPGEKVDFANTVLLYLGEGLFDRKQYEKLYQLYVGEHRHVNTLDNGRFLFLVGRALEAMKLYEQAAVVYYRALALPLTPEDRRDLYYRRAEVYLILKNHAAADRLLTYLRDIYANGKELGEVYYLSGRLSEAKGRKAEALDYYARAASVLTFPEKKAEYAEARLRLLFAIGSYPEVASSLEAYGRQQWLGPEPLQAWYKRLGDTLGGAGDAGGARTAYLAGVAAGMPQENKAAQQMHLKLGEMFFKDRQMEQGRAHLEKAKAGPDKLLGKRAQERLNQIEINQGRKRIPGSTG